MIRAMRQNLKLLGVLLWVVIAAFVGTTFLVWGKGSITGGDVSAVATVNGEAIPLDRYQRRYQAYVDFYRQLYKERFTPELAERLGLSKQVLNDMIQQALVDQWAAAQGLTVGDEELRARIQAIQAFQEGGRFSRERYLRTLKDNRREPASFEADLRGELTMKKVEEIITGGVKVSDAEARHAYDLRREKVRAAWVLVGLDPFVARTTATDEEVQAYLKDHPAEFQRPERRRLQYVVVSPTAFPQKVTDAEVETYYKEHASEFERPQRVRAAHILVRVSDVGGSEAERKSRAKVEEAIRRAKAGEDFAKLAKELSEDPGSAGSGGDLGFVSRGELVPDFERVVFALKKGELHPEPVRTSFGYHAVKAIDVQEADRRPLKDVASQIRQALERERGERAAAAKVERAKDELRTAKDFPVEARKAGLDPKEATVARGEALPGVGRDPGVEESAFSVAVGGTSNPIKTPTGYVLLRVAEQFPAGVPPLAEIKEQAAAAVKRRKAMALALERARALAEAAGKGGDIVALAKKEGLATGETGFVTRGEPAKSPGVPAEVVGHAFQTARGKVGDPIETERGVYLVKTVEHQAADPAGFESERAEIEKQLLERKQVEAWQGWLATLRAQAKIQASGLGR